MLISMTRSSTVNHVLCPACHTLRGTRSRKPSREVLPGNIPRLSNHLRVLYTFQPNLRANLSVLAIHGDFVPSEYGASATPNG
jgi:hypothetical protein